MKDTKNPATGNMGKVEIIVAPIQKLEELHNDLYQRLIAEQWNDHKERKRKFLTNGEAQKHLGLSRPTLQRYRASGALPYYKVGQKVWYKVDELEAFLERHGRCQ